MGVSALYRDKGDEISRKHGDTLIGTLRTSYDSRFANGCTDNEKLSDTLAKLDEPSLFKLVRDYKAGMLPDYLHAWTLDFHFDARTPRFAGCEPRQCLRLAQGLCGASSRMSD